MRITREHLDYWKEARPLPGWAEQIERTLASRRVDMSIAAERARVQRARLHRIISAAGEIPRTGRRDVARESAASVLCGYLRGKTPRDQWRTLANFASGASENPRRAAFARAWKRRLESRMTPAEIVEANEAYRRAYCFGRTV